MKAARDRRTSRWDTHRRSRRAELTDAAITAIRAHGAGVAMDDVAAAAHTSKTAVYRHFADRTQLYIAVCERVAQVLVRQVRAAMDGATGPQAKAAAAIAAYLRLIENDQEVYRFVVHRPLVDRTVLDARARERPSGGADLVADLVSLIGDQVADVIAEQLSAAGADPAPAVPWGHGLVGMVRSAADNWIARPSGMSKDELAHHLTALAWTGLSRVVTRTEEEAS